MVKLEIIHTVVTMFDNATLSLGTTKVMSNVLRIAGSSQQGNARRAPVGCQLQKKKTCKSLDDKVLQQDGECKRRRR